MKSVIARINEIWQPRGGYIKPSILTPRDYRDGKALCEEENIPATVVGLAVDYMTRFLLDGDRDQAFDISKNGAMIAESMTRRRIMPKFYELESGISGTDDQSIVNACKLATFDVWYRNPTAALMAKPAEETSPDQETTRNIRIMLERSTEFLYRHGPVVDVGFTFDPDGYTRAVSSGDGDYLTADTIWELKVTKKKPSKKYTLQLLMYWIMGQHSGKEEFNGITTLGLFNPRLNIAYTLRVDQIPAETIETIEREVLCY